MHSCLYVGPVSHRRLTPVHHDFRYRLSLAYLDLAELDEVLALPWLSQHWGPLQFRRRDHLGDADQPLAETVRAFVSQRSGAEVAGPIRLLTTLANFGYRFNPLSLFYCFDAADRRPEFVVAEVTNTPWGEQHHYLLDLRHSEDTRRMTLEHRKAFHVSPFMPLDMRYHWQLNAPDQQLRLTLANSVDGQRVFSAGLALERHALTPDTIRRHLLGRPLQSFGISAAIYWEALKLWRKKAPFYAHPGRGGCPQADPTSSHRNTETPREQHKIH